MSFGMGWTSQELADEVRALWAISKERTNKICKLLYVEVNKSALIKQVCNVRKIGLLRSNESIEFPYEDEEDMPYQQLGQI